MGDIVKGVIGSWGESAKAVQESAKSVQDTLSFMNRILDFMPYLMIFILILVVIICVSGVVKAGVKNNRTEGKLMRVMREKFAGLENRINSFESSARMDKF